MHNSNNICSSIKVSPMIRYLQLGLDGFGLGVQTLRVDAAVALLIIGHRWVRPLFF